MWLYVDLGKRRGCGVVYIEMGGRCWVFCNSWEVRRGEGEDEEVNFETFVEGEQLLDIENDGPFESICTNRPSWAVGRTSMF